MPAIAATYETVTPKDGYPVQPGQSVTIAVAGRSQGGSSPPRTVDAAVVVPDPSAFSLRLDATRLADGQTVPMVVTAPAGARRGDDAVVEIDSSPEALGAAHPVHAFWVGVCVPQARGQCAPRAPPGLRRAIGRRDASWRSELD